MPARTRPRRACAPDRRQETGRRPRQERRFPRRNPCRKRHPRPVPLRGVGGILFLSLPVHSVPVSGNRAVFRLSVRLSGPLRIRQCISLCISLSGLLFVRLSGNRPAAVLSGPAALCPVLPRRLPPSREGVLRGMDRRQHHLKDGIGHRVKLGHGGAFHIRKEGLHELPLLQRGQQTYACGKISEDNESPDGISHFRILSCCVSLRFPAPFRQSSPASSTASSCAQQCRHHATGFASPAGRVRRHTTVRPERSTRA